jgi:hypothetical protein
LESCYDPAFPTLMIGQLRTVLVSRTVTMPFFFRSFTCSSRTTSTGVVPAFQVTISSMGPIRHTSVPSFLGYYDGHEDTFLGPDTSSRSEAATDHINFSAKLAGTINTTEEIYLFSGKTSAGQLPVLSSEPGEKTYTPPDRPGMNLRPVIPPVVPPLF